jgi:hypothetical protein
MERFRFTDGRMDRMTPPPAKDDGVHLHVHLPEQLGAAPTHDRPAARRPVRGRDQGGRGAGPGALGLDPEQSRGQLLARLLQNGETGDWHAVDSEGRELQVRTAQDGALEIVTRHLDPEETEDQTDPNIVGEYPSGPGRTGDPGAAHDRRRGARALDEMIRTGHTQDPFAATREYGRRVAAFYQAQRAR